MLKQHVCTSLIVRPSLQVLVEKSKASAEALGLQDKVSFVCDDWISTDVSAATVVTMFFISHETINFDFMKLKFRPGMTTAMRVGCPNGSSTYAHFYTCCAGTRFISYVYALANWTPDEVIKTYPHMTDDGFSELYVYSLPSASGNAFNPRLQAALIRRAAALRARNTCLQGQHPRSGEQA